MLTCSTGLGMYSRRRLDERPRPATSDQTTSDYPNTAVLDASMLRRRHSGRNSAQDTKHAPAIDNDDVGLFIFVNNAQPIPGGRTHPISRGRLFSLLKLDAPALPPINVRKPGIVNVALEVMILQRELLSDIYTDCICVFQYPDTKPLSDHRILH